ncbi:uncharacterized protein LOC135129472 [Zophobas morio]|uniref:uncharacterized protein LOC135129472 n=1 Tax=Zophobas morio TaxID=2755281 RepID=UPI003082ABD0
MIGKNHSFFQLLQNDVPHVILLRCICHSASLVASNACTVLPRSSEELLRGIYTYVSGSSKRSAQLQEMQEYFQERKHKILKLSATRWLSHFECVVRILENWNVLEHYFAIAVLEDKLKSAELILSELKNIYTKGYLFFLIYVLNLFNSFNALFQGRKPLIHVLYSECTNLMKQLCKNYLDGAIVLEQNLLTLNLNNPRHFSPLEKLYVGPECSALVKTMPPDGRDLFLKNCLKFYVTAAVDLQRRLPEEIFRDMRFLNPNVAFAKSDDERNIDFNILCDKLKHINADKTEIAIEWRNLPISFSETEIKKFTSLQLHEMWLNICSTKKFSEDLAFPNLGKLVKSILILPHSNAETDRIFSIVTDTKTKKRNRIGESSLNAVAVFRSFLQATELDVVKYPITQDHLQLHNVAMYSFKHS